jgi:hypothetical protein
VFARHLRRLLPADRIELPREVQQNIDMESYRIQQTGSSRIALDRRAGVFDPQGTKAGYSVGFSLVYNAEGSPRVRCGLRSTPPTGRAGQLAEFGSETAMKRAAQPEQIAPAFVFMAAPSCSSYITGEILPIVGGYSGG